MVWFIQMSAEMWNFEETGQVVFHKMINSLLPNIFKQWDDNNAHHLVTIVLFTSVDVSYNKQQLGHGDIAPLTRDYFTVVVDQVHIKEWSKIMEKLRYEFCHFDRQVLLQQDGKIQGRILPAIKGNLLQAIRIASSLASSKFIDRDLRRTGVQTLIITPGTGLFDVDYDLMYQTSLTLLSIEIGVDLVCLSRPPLHVTPLLRYKDKTGVVKHCVPSWLDISFWSSSDTCSKQWMPRCKIYEIQMMGVMEDNLSCISIDYLPRGIFAERYLDDLMTEYDESIFKPLETLRLQRTTDSPAAPGIISKAKKAEPTLDNPLMTFGMRVKSSSSADAESITRKSALTSLLALSHSNATSPVLEPDKLERSIWERVSTASLRSLYTSNSSRNRSTNILSSFFGTAHEDSHEPVQDQKVSQPTSPALLALSSPPQPPERTSSPVTPSASLAVKPFLSSTPTRSLVKRPSMLRDLSKRDLSKDHDSGTKERHSMWMTIINPSNVPEDKIANISNYGRWQFVYPKKVKRRTVKWRTLKSPAALPLLTSSFPSKSQFFENYRFQLYDVTLYSGMSEYETPEELLREIVAIRLSLGFQIVAKDRVRSVEAQTKPFGNPKAVVEVIPRDISSSCRIYMSMGTQIHRIAWEKMSEAVNVQIYTNTDLPSLKFDQKYHPFVKTQYETKYQPTTIDFFKNDDLRTFRWNKIDQFLTGYEDYIESNGGHNDSDGDQKIFCIRLVLVPVEVAIDATGMADQLNAEEVRLEGLKKILTLLHRSKYYTWEERKRMSSKLANAKVPVTKFYTGCLDDFLLQLSLRYSSSNDKNSLFMANKTTERFTRAISIEQLAKEIQSDQGVRLVDRRWHWKTHYRCFMGSELVTWLILNFKDIETPEDAVDYGNHLMLPEQHLFRHVENRHTFMNGHYFYQLRSEFAVKKLGKKVGTGSEKADGQSSETLPTVRPKALISRSIRHNVDPSGLSERPEVITFHVDRIHNPKNCFHIRVEWLNATPKLIDECIIGLGRVLDQNGGLKLVHVPVQEIQKLKGERGNPFVCVARIEVWKLLKRCLSELDEQEGQVKDNPLTKDPLFYHRNILKHIGYVLDLDPVSDEVREKLDVKYSWSGGGERDHDQDEGPVTAALSGPQYVHKSGLSLVQILASQEPDESEEEEREFVFMPNFIMASRVFELFSGTSRMAGGGGGGGGAEGGGEVSATDPSTYSESLLKELKSVCENVNELKGLIKSARGAWKERRRQEEQQLKDQKQQEQQKQQEEEKLDQERDQERGEGRGEEYQEQEDKSEISKGDEEER